MRAGRSNGTFALCLTLALAGCSSSDAPTAEPTPCPTSEPAADLSALPDDVAIGDLGTITSVETKPGFVGAEAIAESSVIEIYPPLARSILDAGYDILSGDNEGFEAEIFFARGKKTTGTYLLRDGPCDGQVTIKLLFSTEGGSR